MPDTRDAKTRVMNYIPRATSDFIAKSCAMAGVQDKIPDGKEELVIAYAMGVIDFLSQRNNLSIEDTISVMNRYVRLVESDERTIKTILDFMSNLSTTPEGERLMSEGGKAFGRNMAGELTALWRLKHLLESES